MNHEKIPKPTVARSNISRQAEAVEQARQTNHRWSQNRNSANQSNQQGQGASWKRDTRILPRAEAREFARAYLRKYPKAAYWSEVESWRVLDDDVIEFTMRRLPTAD